MQYLVCDYYATGEGRCISILITQKKEKLEAAKEFAELFGGWALSGAENLKYDEFWPRYERHVPTYIKNIIDSGESPPAFNYYSQISMNFS